MNMAFTQRPDMRHLCCFVAVARELSFSRAAAKLNLSQQQVSRTIQSLEEIVGTQLLERTTRQVRLSAAGELFAANAIDTLERVDASVWQTRMIAAQSGPLLTLGLCDLVLESMFPEIIQQYRCEYPEVKLELHAMNAFEQAKSIRAGAVHAGFSIFPQSTEGVQSKILLRGRFSLAVANSSHRKQPVTLSSLHAEPLPILVPSCSMGYMEASDRLISDADIPAWNVRKGESLSAMLSLVASGAGVMLVPDFVLHMHRTGIRLLTIVGAPSVELVCTTRTIPPPHALQALIQMVSQSYAFQRIDSLDA